MTLSFGLLVFLPLIAASIVAATPAPACPPSRSQPDPIVPQYPTDVTGTVNGTLILLPVPLRIARAVVPRQYAILTHACAAVLLGFCGWERGDEGDGVCPVCICTYCDIAEWYHGEGRCVEQRDFVEQCCAINVLTVALLLINSVRDHDAQEGTFHVPDVSRFSMYYRFVDLLGDGHSSFAFQGGALIESASSLASDGFDMYGGPLARSGRFAPVCVPSSADAHGALTRAAYKSRSRASRSRSSASSTCGIQGDLRLRWRDT